MLKGLRKGREERIGWKGFSDGLVKRHHSDEARVAGVGGLGKRAVKSSDFDFSTLHDGVESCVGHTFVQFSYMFYLPLS